jgi:sulfur carrier protein
MKILLNGEEIVMDCEPTIAGLLAHIGLSDEKVMACAVDGVIVKKAEWDSKTLSDDQKVELLNFVGGG